MRKCGLYVRVSTDNQARDPEGSLKNQTQRLREELKRRSSQVNPWVEVKLYVEEGVSGKNMNRPKFKELLLDVKRGEITTILCTELSRISRSVIDFLNVMEFFKGHKVELIVLKQNIDTTTPFGKAVFTILVTLAEFEREMTSERTAENLFARATRGLWNGSILLGYDVDELHKGYLLINKDETKVVKLAYRKYLELKSCSDVATYLNKRGYRTKDYTSRRGKHHAAGEFTKQYIHKILTNHAYIGMKEVNKKNRCKNQESLVENKRYFIVDAVWEPVIDKETFENIQLSLKRKFKRSEKQSVNYPFLLSGLAKCGVCGCYLEGASSTKKSGKKYFYYRHSKRSKDGRCPAKAFRAEFLDRAITERIEKLIRDEGLLEQAVKAANDKLKKRIPELKALIRKKRKELHTLVLDRDTLIKGLAKATEDKVQKVVVPLLEEYQDRKSQIDKEVVQLTSEAAALEENFIKADNFKKRIVSISDLLKKLDSHRKRELIASLIDEIVLSEENVEIKFFGSSTVVSKKELNFFLTEFDLGQHRGAYIKKTVHQERSFCIHSLCKTKNLVPARERSSRQSRAKRGEGTVFANEMFSCDFIDKQEELKYTKSVVNKGIDVLDRKVKEN